MKKLYVFTFDCGRIGALDGLFVAEDTEVNETIGKELYFGEVLGKHSEVMGTLDKGDLNDVSEDQDFIFKLTSIFGSNDICGYNPLEYIDEEVGEDE